MKKFAFNLAAISTFCAFIALVFVGASVSAKDAKVSFSDVECRSITIKSDDGKVKVSIQAYKDQAGIWIDTNEGPCVAIYGGRDQGAVIGVFSDTNKNSGMPFAICGDKKEGAKLQLMNGNSNMAVMSAKDLLAMAKLSQSVKSDTP